MQTWELLLFGVIALLVILWFRPGIKVALEQSRRIQTKDWPGVILPLAIVVLFVVLLLLLI